MEIGPFPLTLFKPEPKEEDIEPLTYTIYKIESTETDKVYIGYTSREDWNEFFEKNYEYYNDYLNGDRHHEAIYQMLEQKNLTLHVLERLTDMKEVKMVKKYWIEQYPTSKLCTRLPKNPDLFCIYKISSPSTDKVYIGKSTSGLKGRIPGHLRDSNDCTSRILVDNYDDCEVMIIEQCFKDEKTLSHRENYLIRAHYPYAVNKVNGGKPLRKAIDLDKLETTYVV